jgi:hypothetical protein
MVPCVEGYQGDLDDTMSRGKFSVQSPKKVSITELPLGVSVVQYKTFLHGCEKVSRFEEHHKDEQLHFIVYLTEPSTQIVKDLHLEKRIASSWVALDPSGTIKTYASREEILREFFTLRMSLYERRKAYELAAFAQHLDKLTHEQTYIRAVLANPLNPDLSSVPEQYQATFRKLPMSRLEEGSIARAQQDTVDTKAAVERLEKTSIETLYERDLAAIETTRKRKR